MFQNTDEEVAAEVGVGLGVIADWLSRPEFREALVKEGRELRASAARIASGASLAAAKNLRKLIVEAKDGKLPLDTLKASGAFDVVEESPEESLESILREVAGFDNAATS